MYIHVLLLLSSVGCYLYALLVSFIPSSVYAKPYNLVIWYLLITNMVNMDHVPTDDFNDKQDVSCDWIIYDTFCQYVC